MTKAKMSKATLFEAAHRFNHGIDEAICGVHTLRKSPPLSEDEACGRIPMELELIRCRINDPFLTGLGERVGGELDRLDEQFDLILDETLCHDAVCRLMRVVERRRKKTGQPPLVQFLTPDPDEQPANDQSDASPAEHHTQQPL